MTICVAVVLITMVHIRLRLIEVLRGKCTTALVLSACLLVLACGERKDSSEVTGSAAVAEEVQHEEKSSALPDKVTFNAHIQPILSDKCYQCHGPDGSTREPGKSPLRIDREQFAFEKRENGKPVMIKGKPAESLLVELIKSEDEDEVMPPPKSHKTMSAREIALVEKWIEQGAVYEEHWAFVAPKKSAPPETKNRKWVVNPIDQFSLAKMKAGGLQPNPGQAPHRLIRRIHFDLVGLPPTPEETRAFVEAHAKNPDAAVHALLDRLFKSPAYGEQQARLWLDAARYADTHGIHIDNFREIWPYRDWVVKAFNSNMPFDRFTVEQLGGDLLPSPTLDQKVATGFNRCLPTTGEGGSIAEEVYAMYATDRVATTFGVWQGLTVGCAECHDHKFDPVSQKEFYQLAAFFRNTTMSALDRNNSKHPPSMFVARPEDRARLAEIDVEVAKLEKVVAAKKSERDRVREKEFEVWLAKLMQSELQAGPQKIAGEELHLPLVNPTQNVLTGVAKGAGFSVPAVVKTLPGVLGHAVQVGKRPSVALGNFGDFKGDKGFSFGGFVYLEGKPYGAILARMNVGNDYRGWDFWLQGGQIGSHVIEKWPDVAVKAFTRKPLAPKQWHHVMVVFDPKKRKDSLKVYVNGQASALTYTSNNLGKVLHSKVPLRLGSRSGNDSSVNGLVAVQDIRVIGRPLQQKEVREIAFKSLLPALHRQPNDKRWRVLLRNQFESRYPAKLSSDEARIVALKKESEALKKRGSFSLIMQEKNGKAFAHVLERGNYASKGEKVFPAVPAVLLGKDQKVTENRLGLAKWLVDSNNPLTARVTVNRFWHYIFGLGLVETTEDFGIMGARPSHPDLLDWLAVEFVESGWDVQHLLRLMISSATYRQAGTLTVDKMKRDPKNILLSRSSRFRLHGEQLRDLALSASGLLVDKIGGPPVRPYQPDGIWKTVAMHQSNTRFYKQDKGEGLYRRSLYTIWKRTAPPPSMELLNAPPRETFCVRRELTNTPLAAFVTMNDVQFVEAVRVLASSAIKSSAKDSERLDYITLRLMSRMMSSGEKEIVLQTLKKAHEKYKATPDEAAKLIAVGESPADKDLSPPELAAWTLVASQILNLDETLTK